MSARVEDFVAWAHHTANRLTSPADPDHDDIVQEGLITIARLLDTVPKIARAFEVPEALVGHSAVYLTTAARRAMQAAAYDGKITGLPDRRLRSGPPPKFTASLEGMAEDTPAALAGQSALSQIEAGFERVDWEGFAPAIDAALDGLQARDAHYVISRFYLGIRDAEFAVEYGFTTKAVSNRWASVIRPALRVALADLAVALA